MASYSRSAKRFRCSTNSSTNPSPGLSPRPRRLRRGHVFFGGFATRARGPAGGREPARRQVEMAAEEGIQGLLEEEVGGIGGGRPRVGGVDEAGGHARF